MPSEGPLILPGSYTRGEKSPLARALVKAQKSIKAIAPDKEHGQFPFRYVSAEALIEAGRTALLEAGIALLPTDQTIASQVVNQLGPVCTFEWLLIHEDGEQVALKRDLPICPDKRKGPAAAVAAANTQALAYLYRDLLSIPRCELPEESREEAQAPTVGPMAQAPTRTKAPQAPAPAKNGSAGPPRTGVELNARIMDCERCLVEEGLCNPGELRKYVTYILTQSGLDKDPLKVPPAEMKGVYDLIVGWVKSRGPYREGPDPVGNPV